MFKNLVSLTLFAFSHFLCAQSTQKINSEKIRVFENFYEQKYRSILFDSLQSNGIVLNSPILLLSQMSVFQKNHEEMERGVKRGKTTAWSNEQKFAISKHYFFEVDYSSSQLYAKKVNAQTLKDEDQPFFYYMASLHALRAGNARQGQVNLDRAKSLGYLDLTDLQYAQGLIDYLTGYTGKAEENLKAVYSAGSYRNSAAYYLASIQFDRNKFSDCIDLLFPHLTDEKTDLNMHSHLLVGHANLMLGKYTLADRYFSLAEKYSLQEPTPKLLYLSGLAALELGKEKEGVVNLKNAGIKSGNFSKLAALQLGRYYLSKSAYTDALNSYLEASSSKDSLLREESLFEIAKLQAELGYFSESIKFGRDYLDEYPDSKRAESIKNLLAQSYLRTSNFRLAAELLEAAGLHTKPQQRVYQIVCYRLGLQLYNDAAYDESEKWFLKSLKFTFDADVHDESLFYLAELCFRKAKFDVALQYYSNISNKTPEVQYGIGFVKYNQGKYQDAIQYFNASRNSSQEDIRFDSILRLADCYYATKTFQQAFGLYKIYEKVRPSDYVTFQLALTLSAMEREQEAIRLLESLNQSRTYADKALLQAGLIHMKSTRFTSAEQSFSQILRSFPSSPLTDEARLNRGLCYKNLNQFEKAKKDFQWILDERMEGQESFNAILGLQELKRGGGEVGSLDSYLQSYKVAHPESNSIQVVEYEEAKQAFFASKYDLAAKLFANFIEEYQSTSFEAEAAFYLAESYYRQGKISEATSAFAKIKSVRNEFTGRVLGRLASIYLDTKNYSKAEETYSELLSFRGTEKDKFTATQGLMLTYFEQKQFDRSIDFADQILQASWAPIDAPKLAKLIKARSLRSKGNMESSKDVFRELAQGQDRFGAESNYELAFYEFQSGNYDNSLEMLFSLNEKYSGYTEWVEKSYLLIAKNYLEKKDKFQAKATLQSIVQHAEDDAIRKQATELLNQIEEKSPVMDSLKNEQR